MEKQLNEQGKQLVKDLVETKVKITENIADCEIAKKEEK